MPIYPIRRYATVTEVGDGVPDHMVHGIMRRLVLADWRKRLGGEGYQPVGEPTAELYVKPFPEYVELDGERIKLPDRAWRVIGRAVDAIVPLPPGLDTDWNHIEVPA